MYCKNCGKEMNENQAICLNCGVSKGKGNTHCSNCGAPLTEGAAVCLNCGVAVNKSSGSGGDKSRIVAGLLAVLCGVYGVHNFYLGYTKKAVLQLVLTIIGFLTACLFVGYVIIVAVGIWTLVEGIMLFMGKIATDGNGNPLKNEF